MNKTIKKEYFMVELEVMAPVTLKYRVFAESPEDAIEKISTGSLIESPKPKLFNIRKIKAKVYNFGTSILKYSRTF